MVLNVEKVYVKSKKIHDQIYQQKKGSVTFQSMKDNLLCSQFVFNVSQFLA